MDEPSRREIDQEFVRMIQGLDSQIDVFDTLETQPALLIERLASLRREVPVGSRARFLMTTYIDGELAAYGWRSDLRVTTPVVPSVAGLDEPGVGLIDERTYYLDPAAHGISVGVSRVWVESLVHVTVSAAAHGSGDAWMRGIVTNPNRPFIEPLHPVARRHHLIGARVVQALGKDRYDTDLRAVSSPLMSDGGRLMVAVVEESQWYQWDRRTYTLDDRAVGHLPAQDLWVE